MISSRVGYSLFIAFSFSWYGEKAKPWTRCGHSGSASGRLM